MENLFLKYIGKFPPKYLISREGKQKSQMPTARFEPTTFRPMHHLVTTIVSAAGIILPRFYRHYLYNIVRLNNNNIMVTARGNPGDSPCHTDPGY